MDIMRHPPRAREQLLINPINTSNTLIKKECYAESYTMWDLLYTASMPLTVIITVTIIFL